MIEYLRTQNTAIPRASVRGTKRPGIFSFFFTGPDVDFELLKKNRDVQTVQKTLDTVTGRDDIKVVDITWQGEWRSVILMISSTQF